MAPISSVDEDGATVTVATGTGGGGDVTLTEELPLWPSLVAVICAEPAATAVTSPDVETLATPELLEFQLTARPVRTLLFASLVVAVSCTVPPTVRLGLAGETATDATGTGACALTVRLAPLVMPELVALMVVTPALAALTRPVASTWATVASELCQVIVGPVTVAPLESRSVALA
ncbi:MAG TPA: hypothetical protein VD758_01295 [Gemmatimonadaceae bacterium]|nr:hypothetical protein [Gemmatimonadaceae bacterium]